MCKQFLAPPPRGADFEAQASQVEHSLEGTGMLRGAAERLVLDPTPRSRLRW